MPKQKNQKIFNNEETIVVTTRLPLLLVEFLDLGIAKRVFPSRSEGVRNLALAGLNTKSIQELGVEDEEGFASSLAGLSHYAIFKSSRDAITKSLLLLEEQLGLALQLREASEVHEILDTVEQAQGSLKPLWQAFIRKHLESSPIFVTAYAKYKKP